MIYKIKVRKLEDRVIEETKILFSKFKKAGILPNQLKNFNLCNY